MRFLLVIVLALAGLGVGYAEEVEVVPLRHRTAEQLLPVLQPLVESGGAITGMQSSLVIRTSRRNLDDLKRVIGELDKAPRRLLITVRQDLAGESERRSASVDGTLEAGRARLGINGHRGGDTGATARILDSSSASDERNVSRVQALEGSPAYIAAGQSIPMPQTTVTQGPGGTIVQRSTAFRDLNTGFYVVPYLSGDRVTLEISPQREVPGRYGRGSADVQRIVTTAGGRLGEWFELGGIDQGVTQEGSGILSSRSADRRSARSVWVKVEALQ